ncbi:MAG: branched-chain amino acid transport system permease protein [Solirubrobacteraceae bacterium]
MSLTEVEQLTVAGIINGSAYALLGVSFALVLGVTGRFHYAFALVYTVAAYVTSVLISGAGVPYPLAMLAAPVAAAALGVAIERIVYRPLAAASGVLSLLTIFIAALGITIAGVNGITLIWSSQSRAIDAFSVKPLHVGTVTFTTLELALVLVAWALVGAVAWMLAKTDLGRSIKAVRGNLDLARTIGLRPNSIYLVVFALSSVLCAVAAIFGGMRFAVQPDMGTRPVVFAFVVAFLGGTRSSPLVIGLAGLFLGLVESLSGVWVSPQWASLVVFSVLFAYLTLRPVDLRALRVLLTRG